MPTKPNIYIGADHAGFALKEKIKIQGMADLSPCMNEGDDYPLEAKKVAMAVEQDKNSLGILVCGTGHGMDIAANRMKGVRAIVARTEKDAKLAREHNHANILILGGWVTKAALAKKIVATFLKSKPSKDVRHIRRIKQLDA